VREEDGMGYAEIVAGIQRRIERGELRPGDRVPSTRQLVREWGVAMATATKALTALRQAGLVVARPGVGTVVADEPPAAPPPRARPAPELTEERVVRAGIGVADAEGVAAVSMRRIAAELGVATMSLYRHVPSKDDLLTAMIEAVFGDVDLPERQPAHWRDRLALSTRTLWRMFRRHPWLATAMSLTRPMALPNQVEYAEWIMRAMADTGLSGYQFMQVHLALINHVRGMALNLEWEALAEQETGRTFEDHVAEQDAAFGALAASGRFPHFAQLSATADFDLDLDEQFEFGLRHLLDGFAAGLVGTA
jgi:AcrR family transcriptional regulator